MRRFIRFVRMFRAGKDSKRDVAHCGATPIDFVSRMSARTAEHRAQLGGSRFETSLELILIFQRGFLMVLEQFFRQLRVSLLNYAALNVRMQTATKSS